MAALDFRIDGIGTRNDGTAAVSGGAAVRALGSTTATPGRKGVNIKNHSSTDGIRVYLSESDTAPTISSTSFDVRIAPGDNVVVTAGATVRTWVQSESASGTCSFTAVELL